MLNSREVRVDLIESSVMRAALVAPPLFGITLQDYLWDCTEAEKIKIAGGIGSNPALLLAFHSVNHWRIESGEVDQMREKLADLYTGPIAISAALKSKSPWLIALSLEKDDPNFDPESPVRSYVTKLIEQTDPRVILDVHGAKKGQGFDLAIGTGGYPEDLPEFVTARNVFKSHGFNKVEIMKEGAFSASGKTMTKLLRDSGLRAIQLEISAEFRSPQEETLKYLSTLQALCTISSELAYISR